MEVALYHPGGGTYTRAAATTGSEGDFSTSADVSPLFGRTLAAQAADVHERLGGGPWSLVELGPGRGHLAADLLAGLRDAAPASYERLEAIALVEASGTLRAAAADRVRAAHPGLAVREAADASELAPESVRGLVYANELLDALPVALIERGPAGLAELHVAAGEDGALTLAPRPLEDGAVRAVAERYGLCPAPGTRAEVSVALDGLFSSVARALVRGAALFVDYGHEADALASPRHAAGTLLAYRRHLVVDDPLERPGAQDLTAHVNWSHADDAARAHGLEPAGRVNQDRFLLALGLLDDPALAGDGPSPRRARLEAKRLVMPGAGGGRRFQVSAYVRGVAADLRGLSPPRPPGCR